MRYGCLLSQAFSAWYFSWTSGDPHRSGFKFHTAVLSVLLLLLLLLLLLIYWICFMKLYPKYWANECLKEDLMFIGPCIIVIVEELKTNLMSLAILFHFLCAQHVSDLNISIIRSLRLCCWITTSVVLFWVRCVLEIWCGWFWVVFVL